MKHVTLAVMPVAGMGTRFLPATKAIPKEMLPIVDKPLVAYALEEAYRSGIRQFVFVTSRTKGAIEDHFDAAPALERELEEAGKFELLQLVRETKPQDAECFFVRQDRPLGSAHALKLAKPFVRQDPFAVLLPDEFMKDNGNGPALRQLIDLHERTGGDVIGVLKVALSQARAYGMVAPASTQDSAAAQSLGFRIKGIVEKPQSTPPSDYAAIGRYVFSGTFMTWLEAVTPDAQGEYQMTSAIQAKAQAGAGVVWALPVKADRYDCGSKLGFLQATVAQAMAHPELGPALAQWLKSQDLLRIQPSATF